MIFQRRFFLNHVINLKGKVQFLGKKKQVEMLISCAVNEEERVAVAQDYTDRQIAQWIWKISRSLESQTQITPVASCNTHVNELYCTVWVWGILIITIDATLVWLMQTVSQAKSIYCTNGSFISSLEVKCWGQSSI